MGKVKDFDTKESRENREFVVAHEWGHKILIEQIAAREKRALREANRIFKSPTMRRWWVESLTVVTVVIGFGLVYYFIMKGI